MQAALSHLPNFNSLSSRNLFFSAPLSSSRPGIHRRREAAVFVCSVKRPRANRNAKSNADLCNDIKEFLSMVGLPQDHVPSLKELSQHGREDLARIVRRRGYKVVKQLLETSPNTNVSRLGGEGLAGNSEVDGSYEGQNDNVRILPANTSLPSEIIQEEDSVSSAEKDGGLYHTDNSCNVSESSTVIFLQEKAARFVQVGELDLVEDNKMGIMNESVAEDAEGATRPEEPHGPESASVEHEDKNHSLGSPNGARISNTHIVEQQGPEFGTSRDTSISTEVLTKDIRLVENEAEIKRLRFMLHQKELELIELKQQIEKEKLALSALQTKTETEISKAQKLISERDAELQAVEENLSELKEVEVQYSGEGETVELAGSFNGWHQTVKMDPDPSSIIDPAESRKSRPWRTDLWLYPGLYEIKFIVDGHWKLDPQRETIMRGTIQNNILRVDR